MVIIICSPVKKDRNTCAAEAKEDVQPKTNK